MKKLLFILLLSFISSYASEDKDRYDHSKHERQLVLKRWNCRFGNHNEEERNNNHVTRLSFYDQKDLKNIDFLVAFPNLIELDLQFCGISNNCHVLSGLTHLTSLNLAGTAVTTTDLLKELKNLTFLDLSGNWGISTVKDIVTLPKLKRLFLGGCHRLEDLGLLEQLTNLRELDLDMVLIDDDVPYPNLKFLSSLKKLKILNLSSNDYLFDLNILTSLPRLTHLDLSYHKGIVNINPLGDILTLRSLSLIGIQKIFINDFKFLEKLINLRQLAVNEDATLPKFLPSVTIYR